MEFAPPSRKAKPITKAQLRKMQQNFVESGSLSQEHVQAEEAERARLAAEFDDELNTL